MVSSLAAQLAQNASLNSALISNKSRRKPVESYLFTGREADKHDLESIHALGVNGLLQLTSLNPVLRSFDSALFSDAVKGMDRTLQPAEANAELDRNIGSFLRFLGPHLMEGPTGKVLEWLVRRFRINEFNVEDVLALFLPYHESPHFQKMLTILHIKEQSVWSFLLPFKAAAQSVPRLSLVTDMLCNTDLARFVTALLPSSLKGGYCHRVLVTFNAATLHDFMIRSKALDEGTVAFLLPALLEPLQKRSESAAPSSKDAILGSYVLLTALSQKCHLAPKALKAIVAAMASCADQVATKQFVNAVVCVCEPQDELVKFSDATEEVVLRLLDVNNEIKAALVWVGIENFLSPLLSGLTKRLHHGPASSLLETVLSSAKVPTSVIRRVTVMLIEQVTLSQKPRADVSEARRLLSNIQQRHPELMHEAAEAVISQDNGSKEVVEQLIISFSIAFPSDNAGSSGSGDKEIIDMILASASADAKVRVIAVKSLLKVLVATSDIEASGLESILSALLARVQDTSKEVLDELYRTPSIILPILSKDPHSYLDHVARVLHASASKLSRVLLRVHFTFLASHFCCEDNVAFLGEVFHKIFFPFLLFSKSRQHSADAAWEIIAGSERQSGIATYELLGGCVDTWKWQNEKQGMSGVDKMASINMAIASKIAETIMLSNNYRAHLNVLLAKLQEDDPHSRVFGYLIARALLACLSGENQIDAANQLLQAMGLEQLAGIESFLHDADNIEQLLSDLSLAKAVVLKPRSRNTSHLLQTSILALIPAIPPPMGNLDWLANAPSSAADGKVHLYVGLMRKVYKLAQSTSLPHISINLIRKLFINMKDDALAFLAGIWISPPLDEGDGQFRVASLCHAASFLQAHRITREVVDFQTILPSLIVALQSLGVQERKAALECLAAMSKMTRNFSTVYGFDTIYGETSVKLQYLDPNDYRKYLLAITEHGDHFATDPNYIKVFHQQHLGKDKSDKKKEAEYKRRVLCYLLSHTTAIRLPSAQLALLKVVENVSDKVKAQILLPIIQDLVKDPSSVLAERFGSRLEEFASLVISCFDNSVSSDLNEEGNPSWPIFMLSLRHYFQPGSLASARNNLIHALERGLFQNLDFDRKFELCETLLELGAHATDIYQSCKKLLVNILQEVPLMVRLLTRLQPSANDGDPRASKRAKLTDFPDDTLPSLSLLAEVLGTKPLPGSLDLISRLLETLSKVVQCTSPSQADMSYIQQLLMSAVESAADKIREVPNMIPSAIRLDVLVELIRVVNNPQTFHQALLLMANLARLAPNSVLHHVMPVFTFMGSNVFHRDDSYSFKVVQKTVDSIVPVMVSSLKHAHTDRLGLYTGSRDFLRIFTDTANHIPRHRRTNFFAHLVDVLGPDDFLAPVLMLLIEKSANRVVRQNADEIQISLALPISILHHYSTPVQIFTLAELLRESQRLVSRVLDPKNLQPTFLDTSYDEEHALPPSAIFKRRSQALITFVGYGLKTPPADHTDLGSSMSELMALLIATAATKRTVSLERDIDDITQAACISMNRVVRIMSATDFVHAVLSMVESEEQKVQRGALDLLSGRLVMVADKVRHEITPAIVKIVGHIQRLLTLHPEGSLAESAFRALKTISLTTCPGEETSLTAVVPLLLQGVKNRGMTSSAMEPLPSLTFKLGPRIIPYFRDIVAECVAVLRENLKEPSPIVDDTLKVIHSLLDSIPTFWGTGELSLVIKLYVDQCVFAASSHTMAMSALAKTISKHAPMKAVLPVMCEMWPGVNTSGNLDRFVGYFQLLKRSLHNSPRPVVLEHLRPLFKVFMEAFDVTKISSPRSDEAETQAISAFLELVVKLNEAAFRPLFRRLHDWAFANETDSARRRTITFCHLYIALLDFFKGLMVPYMSFVLSPFVEILKTFASSSVDDKDTWSCVIQTLTKSFSYDEAAFWRDEKLRQIAPALIEQVAVSIRLNIPDAKTMLPNCLSVMTECVSDDALLKTINLNLLMHTRSEDTRLCLFALTCSETLWRAHGGKLLGFVPETTTFITECAEHENDSVVKESRKLKDTVESVAGKVDGL